MKAFSRPRNTWTFTLASALLLVCTTLQTPGNAQDLSQMQPDVFKQLKYRHIGPMGNRVIAVVGVPGDPNTYYVGAASGGIFKTTDCGAHWEPIFDSQPVSSVGSLAIAASDPNVIWAGTGETFIRSNVSAGNGIYKSTDGGKTWARKGLEKTGRIGRVIIHPANPDYVLAAAMGHCYGPQQERGVFRTTDGGETWERVLFVDENTGASDLVMDPNNPRIIFAGMWQMVIWTWGRQSGGPGSGLHVSRDGGSTWKQLTGKGLPEGPLGKIALAMTPNNSQRIYALIETNVNRDFAPLKEHQGELWRSDDGGDSWKVINSDHTIVQRPHYYSRAAVAPDNANEIHFLSMQHSISIDGGRTISRGNAGGDNHDMWIDPRMPNRMVVGHDGGVSISTNRGKSWLRPQLPIAQMYHAYTDNQIPYYVYGNRQDGPSARGPSNSLTSGDIPIGAWHSVGGCESGFAVPDPVDNHIVWSGCYEGMLDRYDHRTGHARNVSVWPDNPEGWPAADLKYRFQWTFPIAISPHDHNLVYAGSQHVHMTVDGGQSWTVISPDLTTNDKTRQQKTGGLTPDDASPTYAAVLFALAESPLEKGLIWAGSNDGQVHVTRDAGAKWVNVTANIPGLPPWGTVSNIEPSRHKPGAAYITVDLHQVNDPAPYIYKTEDYGATWRSLGSGLPVHILGYAHCVREDPMRPGLLFVGTENAVHVSFDDGMHWMPLQTNLPHAPAHWLTIQEHFSDLVVGTYGRGFWILDDITPLRHLTPSVADSDAYLFAPRPAYRFRNNEEPMRQPEDPAAGKNPTYGASIHYYVKSALKEDIQLVILDQKGQAVRTLSSARDPDDDSPDARPALSRDPGINRVFWDLRYERTKAPRLRTKPLEHSHVEIPERGWRPLVEASRFAPLVPPGTYTIKLVIGGKEHLQSLVVKKDPNTAGSEKDIEVQTRRALEIHDNVNSVVDMVNEIEWSRRQVYNLLELLRDRPDSAEIEARGKELDQKLIALEQNFFDLRLSGARQDTLRWPRRMYAKLVSLAGYMSGTDFAPTSQQVEVHEIYKRQLADCQRQLEAMRKNEIAAFNAFLEKKGIPRIVTK